MIKLHEDTPRCITEMVMEECWHEWKKYKYEIYSGPCVKCGYALGGFKYLDPSTWTGFGQWFPKAQEMEWFDQFLFHIAPDGVIYQLSKHKCYIDPAYLTPTGIIRLANLFHQWAVGTGRWERG